MKKKELRKEVLALRDALSQKERQEKSEQIVAQVLELDKVRKANIILLYASMRSEVETDGIYRKAQELGKEIYYPRVIGDKMEFYLVEDMMEFEVSTFGVREPQIELAKQFLPEEDDVVFVLMPGVVFDKEGNRIGYGGGYYDKYLHWLEDRVKSENICKIAVAFACQMVDIGKIDVQEHDVRPDYIVTESDTYTIKVECEEMENSYRYFENRECQYYPCHNMEHMNCLFCYCPLNHMEHCPGNPQFIELNGKSIKDCSGCTFPHEPESYDVIMQFLMQK